MTPYRAMLLFAAVTTYGLILLGGWVRAENAGLSCPDWPTCYGRWVLTPADFAQLGEVGYTYGQMMLEWVHRFVAGIVLGPTLMVIGYMAWRRRRPDPRGWQIAQVLLLLLVVQASLGGVTVLDRNSPWSVALHLGTALLLFATLILLFVREGRHPPAPVAAHVTGLAAIVWVGAILTMTTAAMTAKSGASLACYAWPSCDGSFLPALDDPLVRIHVIHRLGAAATGIGILLLAVAARVDGERRLAAAGALALLLVALQIGLGGVLIILEMPQWTQFAHQATGVLLYALLSFILWTAATSGRAREHGHGRLSHA